jgi:hypothetical protein
VTSGTTTAMATPATVWTFAQVKDSVSNIVANTPGAGDGITYCGTRTYAITGNGAWLSLGTGANNNQLTLLSTAPTDYSVTPYTITLTVTLPAYSDVVAVTTTFTITIGACVIGTVTITGSIGAQSYIIGSAL